MTFIKGQKPWNKGIKSWVKPWLGKKRPNMIGNTWGFRKGKPSPRKGEKGKHSAWNKDLRANDDSRILIGKKHPRYKGGMSRGYKDGYYSADYKKWRMAVFTRDNFTCQGCQKVGGNLNAHHIKQFAFYPKLKFVVSNGITLCVECHKITHKLQHNTLKL